MVEPRPEPEIWVQVPQAKFLGQVRCTNNAMFFSFQWTKLLWSRSQRLLDVGPRTKKFRDLELEPECWVPAS